MPKSYSLDTSQPNLSVIVINNNYIFTFSLRRKKWLQAIKVNDIDLIKRRFVCSAHFKDDLQTEHLIALE